MTATINTPAAAQTTDRPRVWEVRTGTNGAGTVLFHTYAHTMDEARQSVLETAAGARLTGLRGGAFTVHALATSEVADPLTTLGRNVFTDRPAVLGEDWDYLLGTTGVEVRLDTVDGMVDALYLANDRDGMILVKVDGQLREYPAESLHPRCACGNSFRLCHPEA